jgi:hypothetical protein
LASLNECRHALATEEETHVKYALNTFACFFLFGDSRFLCAWVEDYCWAMAAKVHFYGRGEREAFIARCIADLIPTPPAKRGRYKKPR